MHWASNRPFHTWFPPALLAGRASSYTATQHGARVVPRLKCDSGGTEFLLMPLDAIQTSVRHHGLHRVSLVTHHAAHLSRGAVGSQHKF